MSSGEVEEEEDMALIRVTVCNSHTMSTILKTYPSTTAQDLNVILSTKLDINESAKYFALILVYTISTELHGQRHIIRTIAAEEKVLEVVRSVENKFRKEVQGDNSFSSFYFKDVRTAPLEFDHEVSGPESSDEDEEVDASDLNYLKQFKSGYMLVQSSRDPNLYRRRWCVLGEKLWAITLTKHYPRSKTLKEFHSLVYDENQNSITVSGNVNITMRARSNAERIRWVEDLKEKAVNKVENDVIAMAEIIICDEECTRESRMHAILPDPPVNSVHSEIFETRERPIKFDIVKQVRLIDEQAMLHVGLCKSIQNYRELFRHDIKKTVEPWYQYCYALKILRIFGSYIDYKYGSTCYEKFIENTRIVEYQQTGANIRSNHGSERGKNIGNEYTSNNDALGISAGTSTSSFVDRFSEYWNGESTSSSSTAATSTTTMHSERAKSGSSEDDDRKSSSSSSSRSSSSRSSRSSGIIRNSEGNNNAGSGRSHDSGSVQFKGEDGEETKDLINLQNKDSNGDDDHDDTFIGGIVNSYPRTLVENCYELGEGPAMDIFDSICIRSMDDVSESNSGENDAGYQDESIVVVVNGRTELDTSFT